MTARSPLTVLAGPAGAGKSEVATVLRACGHHVVDVGSVLADVLRDVGIYPPDRAHVGPAFLNAFGLDEVALAIRQAVPSGVPVALDAVRSPRTIIQLETWFDVRLVVVTCSESLRRARVRERVSSWTDPGAAERAYASVRGDYAWSEQRADMLIDNSTSLEELHITATAAFLNHDGWTPRAAEPLPLR